MVCGKPLLTPDLMKKKKVCSRGECVPVMALFLESLKTELTKDTRFNRRPRENWQFVKKTFFSNPPDLLFPLCKAPPVVSVHWIRPPRKGSYHTHTHMPMVLRSWEANLNQSQKEYIQNCQGDPRCDK